MLSESRSGPFSIHLCIKGSSLSESIAYTRIGNNLFSSSCSSASIISVSRPASCIATYPSLAIWLRPFNARCINASLLGEGMAERISVTARFKNNPLGSPFSSRCISPPTGTSVSALIPTASRAF